MIDVNRLQRNHVFNVRFKKDKYWVVVKIAKEDDIFVEVEWDEWLKMTDKEKQDL